MRNLLIVTIGVFVLVNCSPKSQKKKRTSTFNKLNLGQPGTTVFANNLKKEDGTHIFEGDESVNFIDSTGLAQIKYHPERSIREGDIIVANSDQRMMLRVVKIQDSTAPGQMTVKTKLANFGDLSKKSEKSSMSFEITPVLGKNKPIEKSNGAVVQQVSGLDDVYSIDESGRIEFKDVDLFSFQLNNDGSLTAGFTRFLGNPPRDNDDLVDLVASAGGQVKGTLNHGVIEIVPTFRGKNEWSWGRPVLVETQVDALVKMKMDVTYKTEGKVSGTAVFDLIKQISVPVRIPGPVPVYVDIELALPVVVKIEAVKASETRVVFEANYAFKGQVAYSKERGTMTTDNERDVQVIGKQVSSTNGSAQLNGELSLQPRVTTRFYRVMGPYLFFQPYIRGELQYPQVEKKDDLFVGVKGGVGVQVSEPVFLTTVLNVDSGDDLFGWETSWDIDGKGNDKAEAFKFPALDEDASVIGNLTDEGFVNVDLKSTDQPNARFALVEGPKHGLAVASKNIFYDGEVMYFPMGESAEDSMKVAFISPDGKRIEKEIKLQISREAIEAAKQDRFGQTTNSTDVAFGHPGEFRDRVGTVSPMKNPRINTLSSYEPKLDLKLTSSCAYIDSQLKSLRLGEEGQFPIEYMLDESCRHFTSHVSEQINTLRTLVEKGFYALSDETLIEVTEQLGKERFGRVEVQTLYSKILNRKVDARRKVGETLPGVKIPVLYELTPKYEYNQELGEFVTSHEHIPTLQFSTMMSVFDDFEYSYQDYDWRHSYELLYQPWLFNEEEGAKAGQQMDCSHNVLEYKWQKTERGLYDVLVAPKPGLWCDTQNMFVTIRNQDRTILGRILVRNGKFSDSVGVKIISKNRAEQKILIDIEYEDFVFRPRTISTILKAVPLKERSEPKANSDFSKKSVDGFEPADNHI